MTFLRNLWAALVLAVEGPLCGKCGYRHSGKSWRHIQRNVECRLSEHFREQAILRERAR